jgi:hypothetical protein
MMVTIADQKRRYAGGVPAKYSTLLAYLRNPRDLCEKKMNNTNWRDICHIAWGTKFNWEGFLK